MTFTLSDARKHDACEDGYNRFVDVLHKAHPDADIEQIEWSIGDVATVNLEDALWCLRLLDDKRQTVAAIMPSVKRASKHTTDERVHFCIAEIERWLAGDDSVDLGAAARGAARGASRGAARAAARAAYAAYAAADAAAEAAWAAAEAAWAAAAEAAEREAQRQDLIAMFPPIALEKQP